MTIHFAFPAVGRSGAAQRAGARAHPTLDRRGGGWIRWRLRQRGAVRARLATSRAPASSCRRRPVTAPELSSLFGSALAAQVEEVLALAPGDVIELGPGSGKMAADVLEALAARDALPERYLMLEVSPELRERQRLTLQQRSPRLLARVAWIDALPPRWRGVLSPTRCSTRFPRTSWRATGNGPSAG
jgi:hypothetical protein